VITLAAVNAPWPQVAHHSEDMESAEKSQNSVKLGAAFLGIKEITPKKDLTGFPTGKTPPERKQVAYLLPFEIVSVHLLVVLIGAAYLARAKRRRGMPT
jgi:NADH-quinone oxidoreductase subunit J